MKNTIRSIAMLLSLLILLGSFVSCANTSGGEDTVPDTTAAVTVEETATASEVTTAEETLFAPDDLDEKYNFNETITIYLWSDHRMTEFYADETGDLIEDAIFKRNIAVSERLGIEFEFVEEKGDNTAYKTWIQKAENDWQSDNAYDIYSGYSRAIPLLTLSNMTANLLAYEAFNVEKPWWPEALTSECTINDKLYFCTGDIATSVLWYMNALMYNKDLYSAHISTDKNPMDLVQNNEWTLDTFFGFVKDIHVDDGNGKKDDLDFLGATIYSYDIDSFQISAGITSLEKSETDGIKMSEAWNSQRCADVCELVGNYLNSPGVYAATGKTRTVFDNQRSIFHLDRLFLISGADNLTTEKIEFSYGVVPVPKFDTAQESFKTDLGDPFSLYAVNSQAKNIEAAVTTLEAMGSENYRSVTPAVFEVAMKIRYTDDPQVSEMFDILRAGLSFDLGVLYGYEFGGLTYNLFKDTALSANPSGFLSSLKKSQRIIDSSIKKIIEIYG